MDFLDIDKNDILNLNQAMEFLLFIHCSEYKDVCFLDYIYFFYFLL